MRGASWQPSNRMSSQPRRLRRGWGLLALGLTLVLVTVACNRTPLAEPPGEEPGEKRGFGAASSEGEGPAAEIRRLSSRRWREIVEAGMVRPECPVQRPRQLRVVEINHFNFEGAVKRGQLVVNADAAESVVRIFSELYEQRFPIRRMDPVEAFDGDTNASLAADNTSAFNCRRADQINAPFAESPHANGRAVDINPRENPWRDLRCDCWLPSSRFKAREAGDGKVTKGGLVWRAFRAEGWIWQNIDVPDYMHFDTGYPSRPLPRDPGS